MSETVNQSIGEVPMKLNLASPLPRASVAPELLFNAGFGGTTRLVPAAGSDFHGPADQYEDIVGTDFSRPHPNVWEEIQRHPNLGNLRIYYEGGSTAQRSATIVPDEESPTNNVLRFSLHEPNVTIDWPHGKEHKARVQTELYGNTDFREFYQTVRLRLHSDLQVLEQFPKRIDWLTVFEFWNQPGWFGLPYPFRISVSVEKLEKQVGGQLFFTAHAQKMINHQRYETIWSAVDHSFALPFATWMDLEIYYREGDQNRGRLYLAVTPAGGERRVILDVHDVTHHPDNPSPSGLTHYSPMKLYTSAELVEFVRKHGRSVTMDWD